MDFSRRSRTQDPMQTPDRGEITQLLDAWRRGEREADDLLIARLYPDLKRLAAASARKINGAGSWQATELLHEAFLSLRGSRCEPGARSDGVLLCRLPFGEEARSRRGRRGVPRRAPRQRFTAMARPQASLFSS